MNIHTIRVELGNWGTELHLGLRNKTLADLKRYMVAQVFGEKEEPSHWRLQDWQGCLIEKEDTPAHLWLESQKLLAGTRQTMLSRKKRTLYVVRSTALSNRT